MSLIVNCESSQQSRVDPNAGSGDGLFNVGLFPMGGGGGIGGGTDGGEDGGYGSNPGGTESESVHPP